MGRLFVALGLVVAVLAAFVPATRAGIEWCDTDPLVLIETPGGALVPVFVTTGALGTEHLPAVLLARMSYTAQPVEGGTATLVHLDVTVPDDLFGSHFPTRSTASSGPLATGTIYATTSGHSGEVMALTFKLAVP